MARRHSTRARQQVCAQYPNTPENVLGLRIVVCPNCRRFNPYGRKEPQIINGFVDPFSMNQWDEPKACHACGHEFSEQEIAESRRP